MDAAIADFAALAGEANAAILRDYVAAVLGRAPADGKAAARAAPNPGPGASAAGESASEAAVGTDSAPPAGDNKPAVGTDSAPPAGDNEPAADRKQQSAPSPRKPKRGADAQRGPKHAELKPIPEKQKRTAVHAFFKTESRLPAMRTETSQSGSLQAGKTASALGCPVAFACNVARRFGSIA